MDNGWVCVGFADVTFDRWGGWLHGAMDNGWIIGTGALGACVGKCKWSGVGLGIGVGDKIGVVILLFGLLVLWLLFLYLFLFFFLFLFQ